MVSFVYVHAEREKLKLITERVCNVVNSRRYLDSDYIFRVSQSLYLSLFHCVCQAGPPDPAEHFHFKNDVAVPSYDHSDVQY